MCSLPQQTCWRAAADLYIHILSSPDTRALQCTVDVIDQELDLLIAAMKKLGVIFYVAGTCLVPSYRSLNFMDPCSYRVSTSGIHATKTEHDRAVARTAITI